MKKSEEWITKNTLLGDWAKQDKMNVAFDILPSTSPVREEFTSDCTSTLMIPKSLHHSFFMFNAPQ